MSLVHTMNAGYFVPTLFANCQVWLDWSDASTVTTVSGNASAIANKVGGVTFNQGTSTKRPAYSTAVQNGRNAGLFDGIDDFMAEITAGLLLSVSGWTIFAAVKPLQNTAIASIFLVEADAGTTAARMFLSSHATDGFWQVAGRRNDADTIGFATSTTQASTSNWAQLTATGNYTATTATLRLNGAQIAQNTSWLTSGSTPNDGGDGYIGCTSQGAGSFWNGYQGEIVMYSRVLSASEIPVVEAFLKGRWATP